MESMPRINKVIMRPLQIEDYTQLSQTFTRTYSDGSDVFWTHEQIEKLIRIFPEGQIVTVVDNKIVGCALSIIVDYDIVKNDHTYASVTGQETFNTHNPKGNILYGIEVFVHPEYRGLRLARRMYDYQSQGYYVWRKDSKLSQICRRFTTQRIHSESPQKRDLRSGTYLSAIERFSRSQGND